MLVLVLLAATGCRARYQDEKFRYWLTYTAQRPPGLVVPLVHDTVKALKLTTVSVGTTNIDGHFWVKSALGDEFKIVVQGVRTDTTNIEIYMPDKRNLDQARLIMTEIRSRVERTVRR